MSHFTKCIVSWTVYHNAYRIVRRVSSYSPKWVQYLSLPKSDTRQSLPGFDPMTSSTSDCNHGQMLDTLQVMGLINF